MKLFSEHQQLLMRRESRVVLGRKAVNLWLLVIVLTATFMAIAFSKGSISYLEEKMNDPFTMWVGVNLHKAGVSNESIGKLKGILGEDSIRQRFLFDNVQAESDSHYKLVTKSGKFKPCDIHIYQNLTNDLVKSILADDNVVAGKSIVADSLSEESMGIILTLERLQELGYDKDSVPSFVSLYAKSYGADSLGFDMLDAQGYTRAPLPLLAVVRRLPLNSNVVASKYLKKQMEDGGQTFNMNKKEYAEELYFFVPKEIESEFVLEKVREILPDTLRGKVEGVYRSEEPVQNKLRSWEKGSVYRLYYDALTSFVDIKNIEKCVQSRYAAQGVVRVYSYSDSKQQEFEESMGVDTYEDDDYLSAHFYSLDSIDSYERFVKDVTSSEDKPGLQIEMTQVNSKRNFWAVSSMARILTAAMIVFSIISIIVFIINMLQSYFQKVRRNLGTFKAFGISTRELTRVYVVIIVTIVFVALVVALAVTWSAELLLLVCGLTKEGGASHLVLWNMNTLVAIPIIVLSTVCSVLFVMRRQLRQTPGNLIYDR